MSNLVIEGGATHSTILLHSPSKGIVKKFKFGPANYILIKDKFEDYLLNIKRTISLEDDFKEIKKIGVAMAGVISDTEKNAIAKVLSKVWKNITNIWVGDDTDTALACLEDSKSSILCLCICGTGSNCCGRIIDGENKKYVGGLGHILGDWGSSYEIGINALKLSVRQFIHDSRNSDEKKKDKNLLLNSIFTFLNLETVNELTTWSLSSSKTGIASLAKIIIEEWINGNEIALKVIQYAIQDISTDIIILVKKLMEDLPDNKKANEIENQIKIGFTGSVLTKNPKYSEEVSKILKATFGERITIEILEETASGGLKILSGKIENLQFLNLSEEEEKSEEELKQLILPIQTGLPATEQRNPNSMNLDKMLIADAIDLMLQEESSYHSKIAEKKSEIEQLILRITKAFQTGGRLFYVGAGTSGRLGILDASECPPTFKSPSHWVQGIISGGKEAIVRSIEGAEDFVSGGIRAIKERDVGEKDIVMGIAASGKTPYVWGSLWAAKNRGAHTGLICFNKNLKHKFQLDTLIDINIGPEVLTGSSRLKSGTATKIILNMLTTLAMVQYGKCYENLMIDLNPVNDKLRDRSVRIVLTILNDDKVTREEVETILISNEYNVRKTIEQIRYI